VAGIRASGAPGPEPPKAGEPTDPKARKTFAGAVDYEKHGNRAIAVDEFRKANKQDGGHCVACLNRAFALANEIGDLKDAEGIARDSLAQATTDGQKATVHFELAIVLQREGIRTKKDMYFSESVDEDKTALQLDRTLSAAHFAIGISLAHLHQDDAARAEFKTFLEQDKENQGVRARAARYIERVELARATMAPPFSLVTLDGRHVTMDDLTGKVVLIDFWATWCGPCREALPHIRHIAQEFNGQPLVVLSVSMDRDEAPWKDFVTKNGMSWMQYRDGYFSGPMAKMFAVNAIPATFSIDADGVLEDQHVGDANIEGKLKKMIARAVEVENRKQPPDAAVKPSGAGE
jgi:thiol-disulfide isomerase/thioredoxin